MKSIFLTIPTLHQGGAERVISELANNWIGSGYKIYIVLLDDKDVFFDIHEQVSIICLNSNSNSNRILKVYRSFIEFRRLVKMLKPVFILSFMTPYNIFTIASLLFMKQNIIVSDRANLETKRTLIERLAKPITYNLASGIIAQTQDAQHIIYNQTRHNNIVIIPNPVHDPGCWNFAIESRENIILNVGRLIPEKGQEFLIEVFSKLNRHDFKLVILGDGPCRASLEKLIQEKGLTEDIILKGKVKDVHKWYEKSKIFAFTSISEGFPNSLAEAMSTGLPSVSFNCKSGPSDLINHCENGFLVENMNTNDFKLHLQSLIDDQNLLSSISKSSYTSMLRLQSIKIANDYLNFCLGCTNER